MSALQEIITASVPPWAPFTPPDTGESTQSIPFSARPAATIAAALGPEVERSITVRTLEPDETPSAPSITDCRMSGVGRLVSTISTRSATALADGASSAPLAAASDMACWLLS